MTAGIIQRLRLRYFLFRGWIKFIEVKFDEERSTESLNLGLRDTNRWEKDLSPTEVSLYKELVRYPEKCSCFAIIVDGVSGTSAYHHFTNSISFPTIFDSGVRFVIHKSDVIPSQKYVFAVRFNSDNKNVFVIDHLDVMDTTSFESIYIMLMTKDHLWTGSD